MLRKLLLHTTYSTIQRTKKLTRRPSRSEASSLNIVVIQVVKRTSESFYNDRVSDIIVIYKPLPVRWEEPDPRRVKVVTISIGPFREYPLATPDIIENFIKEQLKDYVVERIRI